MARLREWSRTGRKLGLRYVDEAGARSDRVVWPFMVGDVAGVRALIAWCERRGDFRVFRIDGIDAVEFLTSFSPTSAGVLRRRWLAQEHQRKAVRAADAPDTRDAKWEI